MDLMCIEAFHERFSPCDPVIYKDQRVLMNLLKLEESSMPHTDYFLTIQPNLEPFMRKVITSWMLEVCEDQKSEDQVFPRAISLLDRFLCVCPITRGQFQLLAAASLLVSSKIGSSKAFSVEHLCFYTENSISASQILDWELLLVSKLGWDLNGVTGSDFVDQILERLPSAVRPRMTLLRSHARTLLALAYTDSELIWNRPSTLGSAAVVAGARGLRLSYDILDEVCAVTNNDKVVVESLVNRIEHILKTEAGNISANITAWTPGTPDRVNDIHF